MKDRSFLGYAGVSKQPAASSGGGGGTSLEKVYSPNGAYFSVNKQYAPRFQGFLGEIEKAGYKINQGESGGYNYRNIAGTNRLSNHAHGNAIDINWNSNPRSTSNPYGSMGKHFGSPDKINEIAGRYGMKWGGNWKNPDAMHFEVDTDWNGSLPGKGTPPPTIMQQARDPGYTKNTRSIAQPSSITPGAMSMPQTNTMVMSDKNSGGSLTLPNFGYPGAAENGWSVGASPSVNGAGASGERVLNPSSGMMDNRLAPAADAPSTSGPMGAGWRDQPPRPAPGSSASPVAQPQQPSSNGGAQWVNGTYGTGIQWGNGDTSFTRGPGNFAAGTLTDKPAPAPSGGGLAGSGVSTSQAPAANWFKGLFGG